VKLMLAAGCGLSAQSGLRTEDFAALVQSLTALTALRKLDMHCESLFGLSLKAHVWGVKRGVIAFRSH
jgi:hypothetical protein